MTVLWIVPFSLVGAKWLRYALSLMPLIYMVAAVGVVWLARLCGTLLKGRGGSDGFPLAPTIAGAAAAIIFIVVPAWHCYKAMPHYALYTNALGGASAGYYFPHDEFYDDGLREAISHIADRAPQGAIIAHETPGVVRYYLEKFGRTDLRSRVISDPRFDARAPDGVAYFILQRGRTYFENRDELEAIRAAGRKEHEVFVRGVSAAEVYVAGEPPRAARLREHTKGIMETGVERRCGASIITVERRCGASVTTGVATGEPPA